MTDLLKFIDEKKSNFAKFLENIHIPGKNGQSEFNTKLNDYISQIRGSTPELFSYYIKEKIGEYLTEKEREEENKRRSEHLQVYVIKKLEEIGIKHSDLYEEDFNKFVEYLEMFIFLLKE